MGKKKNRGADPVAPPADAPAADAPPAEPTADLEVVASGAESDVPVVGDLPVVEDARGDRADAFAVARKSLEEPEKPEATRDEMGVTISANGKRLGRPPLPPKTAEQLEAAKLARRLRERNARREAKGEAPMTMADLLGEEAADGGGLPRESTPRVARSAASASVVRRRSTMTRDELEAELARKSARLDALESESSKQDEAMIANALAETTGALWDAIRAFTPSPGVPLSDEKRIALGEAWSPVLAPYMSKIAGSLPIIAAIGVTYRVMAPEVARVMADPSKTPTLRAASEVREVMPDAGAPSSPDAPPVVEGADFPRPMGVGEDRPITGDGYTPEE